MTLRSLDTWFLTLCLLLGTLEYEDLPQVVAVTTNFKGRTFESHVHVKNWEVKTKDPKLRSEDNYTSPPVFPRPWVPP